MISTSLFFSLRATPGGELDLWEEMAPGHRGTGRVARRPADFINQPAWAGHRVHQQPLVDFSKKLFKEFKIRHEGYSHGSLELSSPRLGDFCDRMVELQPVVCFESGNIRFTLTDDETTPCEWFVLNPQEQSDSINGRFTESETCRAERMPQDVHCVRWNFVSEDFKRVVDQHRFTGAKFIWLPDTGKKPARQWFRIVAHEPIGRGIDHDWFDPQTLTGRDNQTANPTCRQGVTRFYRDQFKPGAGFGDSVKDRLIAMFPANASSVLDGLHLLSFPRMLRAALPKTDFAFTWNGDGRLRLALFNRVVRDALITEGVLSKEECEPLLVVDELPTDVLLLDGAHSCPPPYEPIERLEHVLAEATAAWDNFSAKRVLNIPGPSLSQVLDLMREEIGEGHHQFNPPTTTEAVAEATRGLPLKVPALWQQILLVADGAVIYGAFGDLVIQSADHIHGCHEDHLERASERRPDFPAHLLHVAVTGTGDFVSLDTSKLTSDGDCPVILMSHETLEPDRTWVSIPAFLEEVFELAGE